MCPKQQLRQGHGSPGRAALERRPAMLGLGPDSSRDFHFPATSRCAYIFKSVSAEPRSENPIGCGVAAETVPLGERNDSGRNLCLWASPVGAPNLWLHGPKAKPGCEEEERSRTHLLSVQGLPDCLQKSCASRLGQVPARCAVLPRGRGIRAVGSARQRRLGVGPNASPSRSPPDPAARSCADPRTPHAKTVLLRA